MSPLHVLAHTFTPSPEHGLAFSAMPDAPVLPYHAPAHRLRTALDTLRRTGARLRAAAVPLRTAAPSPVRADCPSV